MTLLSCPYCEKDEAKTLGARWNASLKKWYVPAGQDLGPFAKWLPQQSQVISSGITCGQIWTKLQQLAGDGHYNHQNHHNHGGAFQAVVNAFQAMGCGVVAYIMNV